MKKRILTIALTVALLIVLIPLGATPARAVSNFAPSEQFIQLLKTYEGFSAKPFWDYKQWTVGYGTKAPSANLDRYNAEGISEEEALQLLNAELTKLCEYINSFIDKFQLNLTQNQFDSILSMSYNCGANWINGTGFYRTAIIDGWTGSDFMFALGQWSSAGGATQTGLIRRRLSEANMYLYGIYDSKIPSNFCYVRLDPNGGTTENRVQCYDSNMPAAIRAVPTYEGYKFEGWYTDPTGGEKVEILDAGVRNFTLYAHWSEDDGSGTSQGNPDNEIKGETVNYDRQVATNVLNTFKSPVKGSAVIDAYNLGDLITIVEEYTDASGIKWGKVTDGSWVNLEYTQDPTQDSVTGMNLTVTVTGVNVNVRRGPGTAYAKVSSVTKGDRIVIMHVQQGGGYTWGKFSGGWVALKYTNYKDVLNGIVDDGTTPPETTPPETTPPETTPPETTPPETTPPETTPPETTPPETTPPETTPPETTPPETTTPGDTVVATGKIKVSSTGKLNIRGGASTGYPIVGHLRKDDPVEIFEIVTVGSTKWGRISQGWISLSYVTLDKTPSSGNTTTTPPDSNSGGQVINGTIIVTNKLNVRKGAGTQYSIVDQLKSGTKVQITEKKTVNGKQWGKISKGWICMDYVRVEDSASGSTGGSTGSGTLTGTIKANNKLRIRSGPGTSFSIAGYLPNKTPVEILEQVTVGNKLWGRVDKGWISMDYVVLDKQSGQTQTGGTTGSSVSYIGTITASCLNIRSGAGTSNKIVGRLYNGAKVTILETKVVNGTTWARIDKGWISMKYVK